jgi:nucleotide-binding universal stress UspA family protein
MYAQILVPLDGSRFSEQALPYARDIARRSNAMLHLVKVHALTPLPSPYLEAGSYLNSQFDAELRQSEAEYLERVAAAALAGGATIRCAVVEGPVVNALEAYVQEAGITMIVMTTHGRGGLSRAWLGSVADGLVRGVNVPLLLLRPRGDSEDAPPFGLEHILIPMDGSEFSEQVLEHAITLGRLTNARYTLVQVVQPPVVMPPAEIVAVLPPLRDVKELRAQADRYLEEQAERMRADGLIVDTVVVTQMQSALGILEESLECDADLIAMATHGRGGWQRVALGSVADKVLRGTSVPMLLLRPGAAGAGSSSAVNNVGERAQSSSGIVK